MQKINKISSFILALIALPLWQIHATEENAVLINQVVARVNDRIVTMGEIDREIKLGNYSRKEDDQIVRHFIEERIESLLSVAAFEEKGFVLPESYIDKEYKNRLSRKFRNNREEFREYLQATGQTPEEYKLEIKEEIIRAHMQRSRSVDEISPQSVEDYYNQNQDSFWEEKEYSFREIVFRGKGKDEFQKLKVKTQEISDRISAGESFEELASQFGDSSSKGNGGLCKNYTLDLFPKAFTNLRKILSNLKPGESSPPFFDNLDQGEGKKVKEEERFEWRVLKLEQASPSQVRPLEEVRSEIEKILAQNARSEAQRKWLSQQELDAFVDRNID